ncbi:hypothetical protein ACS0TY_018422 [Phlomoides rotata]
MKSEVVRSETIVIQVSPFNSTQKQDGVALRGKAGSDVHVHWKGAAEIILESCSQNINLNDSAS